MTLRQAKNLLVILERAIHLAEASGEDEVSLIAAGKSIDDAAREELDQALRQGDGA